MLQSLQPIANFSVFDYVPMCQIVHGWKYHVNELIHQQVRAYKDLAKIMLSMLYNVESKNGVLLLFTGTDMKRQNLWRELPSKIKYIAKSKPS